MVFRNYYRTVANEMFREKGKELVNSVNLVNFVGYDRTNERFLPKILQTKQENNPKYLREAFRMQYISAIFP